VLREGHIGAVEARSVILAFGAGKASPVARMDECSYGSGYSGSSRVRQQPDRLLAEAALTERREESRRTGDSSLWSLGTLRPLDPGAPGTRRYRVIFTLWESREDRFERRTVQEMELWATNATTARRIAQLNVQSLPAYIPAWRIQGVERIIDNDLP
jgi:hypothetical protein